MGPYEDFHEMRDMAGQKLGFWRDGQYGRQIERVGKGMSMTVIAYRRRRTLQKNGGMVDLSSRGRGSGWIDSVRVV